MSHPRPADPSYRAERELVRAPLYASSGEGLAALRRVRP